MFQNGGQAAVCNVGIHGTRSIDLGGGSGGVGEKEVVAVLGERGGERRKEGFVGGGAHDVGGGVVWLATMRQWNHRFFRWRGVTEPRLLRR